MDRLSDVKAVIFDLDGTLIDTEKIYRQVWPKALADMGYVMKDEHYLAMRSLGRPFAPFKMRVWFGPDFDYDRARKIRKTYFDAYIRENGIDLKDGAIKLLEHLRNKGIITAIATATDITRATEYLDKTGLTNYFDKIISATMVKEGKPSPYVYMYACEALGFLPSECVAVEDAPNGVTSAFLAGLKVIMVPDQSAPTEEDLSKAYVCLDSLDEICEII